MSLCGQRNAGDTFDPKCDSSACSCDTSVQVNDHGDISDEELDTSPKKGLAQS